MLKWIEEFWDLLNILVSKLENFAQGNQRFKTSCLQMSPITRDISSLLVRRIKFALMCCTVRYRTRRANRPRT